jgi:tRNA nucleotidyltransferase (CCA-adding enzyme)
VALLSEIIQSARGTVTPKLSEYKSVDRVAKKAIELIRKHSENSPFHPETIIGGSYARDTWLPSEVDLDIFLRYPVEAQREDLENDSHRISSDAFGKKNLIIRYAEHPYVETYISKVRINIVPCYDVTPGNWISAVDRSPFHLEFIKKALNSVQKNDVRLLKKFMKKVKVYGAEIKVGGFSGYFCEVLVYRMESFENIISSASKWKLPLIITDEDKQDSVKQRFKGDKIIVTDPIDINRNLGRALSIKALSRFVIACRMFAQKPSMKFFVHGKGKPKKNISNKALMKNVQGIIFKHPKMSADILWGMLNRTLNNLTKQSEKNDFRITRSIATSNDLDSSAFLFLFEITNVAPHETRVGPSVFEEENFNKFVSKNLHTSYLLWINNQGRICALRKRTIHSASMLLREYVKEPLKYGISKNIAESIRTNHRLCSGEILIRGKKDWIIGGVSELLEPKDQDYLS